MGDAKSEPESTAAEDNFQQQFFKNFGAASALEGQAGRFSYFINTQHPPVSGSQVNNFINLLKKFVANKCKLIYLWNEE